MVGGATGDRTPDLMSAIHALSQLSYRPKREPGRPGLYAWRPAVQPPRRGPLPCPCPCPCPCPPELNPNPKERMVCGLSPSVSSRRTSGRRCWQVAEKRPPLPLPSPVPLPASWTPCVSRRRGRESVGATRTKPPGSDREEERRRDAGRRDARRAGQAICAADPRARAKARAGARGRLRERPAGVLQQPARRRRRACRACCSCCRRSPSSGSRDPRRGPGP